MVVLLDEELKTMVLSAIVFAGVCGEVGKTFYGLTLLRGGVVFFESGGTTTIFQIIN